MQEPAIGISAPYFLATLMETLSSECEVLQRSLAHGHHDNRLQGVTKRAEGKSDTYQGVPDESHFHREGPQSLHY